MSAIVVNNLHRRFANVHAVNGISFAVEPGQVVGFVGANGAGKTTTMRILATLDYPTQGVASIHGHDVLHDPQEVRKLLGWVPDSYGTYENVTVYEYLDFYARAYGLSGQERTRMVGGVMEFTDLNPLRERYITQLSKGQGQRLCLGRALLNDPKVLILDEPAAGLDPKARVELKNLIRILASEGKTMVISSHILSELAEMCDTLLFIDKGKLIYHGSAQGLQKSGVGEVVYDVVVAGEPGRFFEWATLEARVKLGLERTNGGRITIDSQDDEVVQGVLRRMVEAGVPVVDFHREVRKLEDAFIDILGQAG